MAGRGFKMKQITLNNVCFAYDTDWIIENLNLAIEPKDGCILLTGKNGAGKSTLLNVLCGFLPPDYGSIERIGMTIGYLPFEHPLYRHLSVLENLRYFYRSFQGKNLDLQDTYVQEVLQALSIDYLNQRIDQCSSGQEQKAGIACILLSNADMVIMDEPFVAMDAKSSEYLCNLIRKKSQDTVFLITSHTSAGIIPIADRLLALDGHQLILDTREHTEIKRYFQAEDEAV